MKKQLLFLSIILCLFVTSCSSEVSFESIPDINVYSSKNDEIKLLSSRTISRYYKNDEGNNLIIPVYMNTGDYENDERIENINNNPIDTTYTFETNYKYNSYYAYVSFLDDEFNPLIKETNESSDFPKTIKSPSTFLLKTDKKIISFDFNEIPETILTSAKYAMVNIKITYSQHNIFSYEFDFAFNYQELNK
jgi:hypothetical protein